MRAYACTRNRHKVEELGLLLPLLELQELPAAVVLPPETGATFLDNARLKARAGHEQCRDAWVLADDSGLIVDALDGAPGVRSARFASEHATDAQNIAHLLAQLSHLTEPTERRARFTCVLVLIAPDGREFSTSGSVEGTIAAVPSGTEGFGYDPVFVPEGERASFAVLGARAKARMSHRARAAQALGRELAALS